MRTIIDNTLREYNKYHSPEGETKLVSTNDEAFKIEFTGSFCFTGGFHDYFDDYNMILREKGLNATITEVIEVDDGAVVTFAVLGLE